MLSYVLKRIVQLVPILFLISVVSFSIIELPPGDFADFYISSLRQSGMTILDDEARRIKEEYGFNKPLIEKYLRWLGNIVLNGNFGYSFEYQKPVNDIIWDKLPLTIGFTLGAMIISWIIAIPIGIYSALNQYSKTDYIFTFIGFIGLATPPFLMALLFAWFFLKIFDYSGLGIVAVAFASAPFVVFVVGLHENRRLVDECTCGKTHHPVFLQRQKETGRTRTG